jgi:hypothetical protein
VLWPDFNSNHVQYNAKAMKVSLDRLIGRRLIDVMIWHGSVQLLLEDDYVLTIYNPILITSPAGDIDCSQRGRDFLRELMNRSVSNVQWKQGRIALVFADAVVSVGRTKKDDYGMAMLVSAGLPGSGDPVLAVPIKETRFDSYPFDC